MTYRKRDDGFYDVLDSDGTVTATLSERALNGLEENPLSRAMLEALTSVSLKSEKN